MDQARMRAKAPPGTWLIAALLLGLAATRAVSYLLFHTLVETFTVAVGWSLFFLAWNARRFLDNHYLLLVGISALFVGGIDALHLLTYKGMGVFPGGDADLPTQLWLAGRYLQSLAFLAAPFFIRRKLNTGMALAVFAAASALLVASILGGRFPVCYAEGAGLTPFKMASEYIVAALLLAAAYRLLRERRHFEAPVLTQLASAILLHTAASLAFTLYVDVYGAANTAGHLLRFLAFCLTYQAVIVTGLVRPNDLLFRNLAHSEAALRTANEKLETAIAALRRSEDRYRAFVANSSEGICRFEIDPPVPVDLPEEEQVARLLENARLAECNDVYARMHGVARPEEIAGTPLPAIMARSASRGPDTLRAFIRSGYRMVEEEVRHTGADGGLRFLSASFTGVIEDGYLVRAWGVERDITERQLAAAERERLIGELQQALAEVRTLSGLLPMCANCKKIRDDQGYWTRLEAYFHAHSDISFTHGICPECMRSLYPDFS